MSVLHVAKETFAQCESIANEIPSGKELTGVLSIAGGMIGSYTEHEVVDLFYRPEQWDKLAKATDNDNIGDIMYAMTHVFNLRAMMPAQDKAIERLLTKKLEPKHKDGLAKVLRKLTRTAVMHVHRQRRPTIEDGQRTYKHTYKQHIKVLSWAKKFDFEEDLEFEGETKKRKAEEEETHVEALKKTRV